MDEAGALTATSLVDLAELSDSEALKAFHKYLVFAAILFLIIGVLFYRIVGGQVGYVFGATALVFFYTAGSINAWSNNRAEIVREFIGDAKKESGRYVRYYLIFSIIILVIVGSVGTLAGELTLANFGPLIFFIVAGLIVVIGSLVLAKSASVAVVFAPALVAMAYLWITIMVARGVLVVGKRRLVNFLIAYFIIGSSYITLLSFPALRVWFGVPACCQ